VTEEEAEFALQMAILLTEMTQKQQKSLASIMLAVANSKDKELSIFKNTRVPVSVHDFQQFYLSGSNAIIPNLPHPVIKTTQDGTHAYVRLSDVIANMLAADTPVQKFEFEAKLSFQDHNVPDPPIVSTTPAAYDLYMELKKGDNYEDQVEGDEGNQPFVLYIWLKEWRDDFDPSHTKSSRGQVWIDTYTIGEPASEKSGRNTFFMAIGAKGDDHKEIERLFTEELEALSRMGGVFFHGGLKRRIRVKVGKIMTCVDRPERTAMFRIGDHNGAFSVIWGYAARVDGLCKDNHLPSCPFCRKKRLENHLNPLNPEPANIKIDIPSEQRVGNTEVLLSEGDVESTEGSISSSSSTSGSDDAASQVESDMSTASAIPSGPNTMLHSLACEKKQCSSWDLLDPYFTSAAPSGFPTTYDSRAGAPLSPKGREIVEEKPVSEIRLPAVRLTIEWLTTAVVFAHHQVKTNPPNTNPKKRFWTKGNLEAYLRTCGLSKKLMDTIYNSAKVGEAMPLLPATWSQSQALRRCHFAAMHMLFLGHVKSNYDMEAKFLSAFDLRATFGKQANTYLRDIQNLRLRRFFNAQPLSTSAWGTGNWVSENYLFWARAQKFFFCLPAIHQSKHAANPNFVQEVRILGRFVVAALACLSRLMSDKKAVGNMDEVIKIYLDTMVEMDHWLLSSKSKITHDEGRGGTEAQVLASSVLQVIHPSVANAKKKKGSNTKEKQPNFVKSNSLGLLECAYAHAWFGPCMLHWEGSYSGEKKIQEVKPLLGIKRQNADWPTIVLRRLYQNETLNRLLDDVRNKEEKSSSSDPDVLEGVLRVYKSRDDVNLALKSNVPLSAVQLGKQSLWIAYRGQQSRSSVELLEICFDDAAGEQVCDICWCAPIWTNDLVQFFDSMGDIQPIAEQYILLLPRLDSSGTSYENYYHAIGNKWTERTKSGLFQPTEISEHLFRDWRA
jgi:hypothetical protein